jgi:hypothetical protein
MNWYPEDKFLRIFLVGGGVSVAAATCFLLYARMNWNTMTLRLNEVSTELNRLERMAPYPSAENLKKAKAHLDDYAKTLVILKDDLKARVFPIQPLAPTDFQSRLRLAMTALADKARGNKVKLPDKFCLGFDEYASALPNMLAAPLLGQELTQVEFLLESLVGARVDALTTFRRTQLREEREGTAPASAPINKPAATTADARKVIERNLVEATFISTPAAARQFLNQIAGANQHLFIIRLLRVRNEKEKGPAREVSGDPTNVVGLATSQMAIPFRESKSHSGAGLNFIVGNEQVEVSTTIEMVRFTF